MSCQEQNIHLYFILPSPQSDNCNTIKARSHNDADTEPCISLCYIEGSVSCLCCIVNMMRFLQCKRADSIFASATLHLTNLFSEFYHNAMGV